MSNIEFGQYVKSLDNVQNLYEAVGFDLASTKLSFSIHQFNCYVFVLFH